MQHIAPNSSQDQSKSALSSELESILNIERDGYRKKAIKQLQRYLKDHSDSAEGWYYLARFSTNPRQQKQAVEQALHCRPDYPEASRLRIALLEEYPYLKRPFPYPLFRVVGITLFVFFLLGLGILGGAFFFANDPQEVVILVPTTQAPTAPTTSTAPEFSPIESPTIPVTAIPTPTNAPFITDTPQLLENPPTITQAALIFNPTQAAATPIISVTPMAESVQPSTTPDSEAFAHAHRILIASTDGTFNNQLIDALKTQFNGRDIDFQTLDTPINDESEAAQQDAILVIYGTLDGESLQLKLYAPDDATIYRNKSELMFLDRLTPPWKLSLDIPQTELNNFNSPNFAPLYGAVGYVSYYHDNVITALSPLFQTPSSVLDEQQAQLVFMLSYAYQALGQHQDALRIYDILTTYTTTAPDPLVASNRAYAIAQTGDQSSAIKLYLELVSSHPDPAFIQSNIGEIYMQMPEGENAAQLALEEAIRLDPNNPRPYLSQGRLLKSQNQYNRALEDFSTAIRLDSTYAVAYYERARLRADLNLLSEALQDIERAITAEPLISNYYILRGKILLRQQEWENAATALEEAIQYGGESSEAYALLAQAYFELGNLDGTIRASNTALTLDQDNVQAWLQRGRAYFAQNEIGSALNDFSQGLERNPEHVPLLVARCTAYARLGNDGNAALDCDQALALDGVNGRALEQRGLIRARAGDRAGAAEDFAESILYTPNAYEAHYYLGLYALQEGRYSNAIDSLTTAINLAPYLGKAYAARGVAYRISGEWEKAIADLQRTLEIVPEDIYSYYELGLSKRYLADRAYEQADIDQARLLYNDAADALLTFLNASQPNDPFVNEAQNALNYINNALSVIDSSS